MNIIEVTENLYLIDLPQKLEGFRKFISSWVVKDDKKAMIVDVGPASTISTLVNSLKFLGIEDVEFVLLTHIHLDHAGGIGHFLEYYPNAKIVVHEKGKPHLINPEKLWKGSLKVLVEVAEVYGEPKPVPESSIYDGEIEFAGEKIEIVKTPGHASHHQSYVYGEFLFVGETVGVHMPLKNDYYLRPATPSRFVYEVAYDSIEKIINLGEKRLCFGHFGFKKNSVNIAEKAKNQLKLWVNVVYDIACRRDFQGEEEILKQAKSELLEKDERFSKYHLLDDDIKKREDYFINNSLKGILEYVYANYCEP